MIRAAVAGLGWWGRTIVERVVASDRLRIIAAIEPDAAAHREFARQHDLPLLPALDDALADAACDAVILATPHHLHTAQVLAAAAAGKHVFCEKPLALNRADAERSVAACRDAGVVLGLGHERRFEPGLIRLREMVRDGALGTILHAEGSFSHDKFRALAPDNWRLHETPATVGMHGMAIHLTDACIAMLGAPSEVQAVTAGRVIEAGDVVALLLRFASGPTAYVTALSATPLYLRLAVFGSEGWVEIRNHTHPDTPGPQTLIWQPRKGDPREEVLPWTDTVRANLEAFADAAEGRSAYPISDAEKIANTALLEAVTRAVTEGARVAI